MKQSTMFDTGADLPLFSQTPQPASIEPYQAQQSEGTQSALLDTRPQFEPYSVTHCRYVLEEVEMAALWCHNRGLTGTTGEALPELISTRALAWIRANPRGFREKVAWHKRLTVGPCATCSEGHSLIDGQCRTCRQK